MLGLEFQNGAGSWASEKNYYTSNAIVPTAEHGTYINRQTLYSFFTWMIESHRKRVVLDHLEEDDHGYLFTENGKLYYRHDGQVQAYINNQIIVKGQVAHLRLGDVVSFVVYKAGSYHATHATHATEPDDNIIFAKMDVVYVL